MADTSPHADVKARCTPMHKQPSNITLARFMASVNIAGAGVASVVWPGGGTLIGYNAADILISIFLVGPFTEKYISMEPPPAALDAGRLDSDPPMHGPQIIDRATGTVTELDGSSDDLSDDKHTAGKHGLRLPSS